MSLRQIVFSSAQWDGCRTQWDVPRAVKLFFPVAGARILGSMECPKGSKPFFFICPVGRCCRTQWDVLRAVNLFSLWSV